MSNVRNQAWDYFTFLLWQEMRTWNQLSLGHNLILMFTEFALKQPGALELNTLVSVSVPQLIVTSGVPECVCCTYTTETSISKY